MENDNLIPAEECCTHYNIEISFVSSLNDAGLIEITTIDERNFIHQHQLSDLEKYIRLHYDLDINVEGLETIAYMLEKMKSMQQQVMELQKRLRLYEEVELNV
ncbi:MAG: chaperone modulator CbpM [Chitinophagaceae bacterium]